MRTSSKSKTKTGAKKSSKPGVAKSKKVEKAIAEYRKQRPEVLIARENMARAKSGRSSIYAQRGPTRFLIIRD